MTQELVCNSCKRKVTNSTPVVFPCPACKTQIVRCANCRSIAAQYKCTCGFEGPN